MRVIVAGSRSIADAALVAEVIEASGFPVAELVSGCAAGVDSLCEAWAKAQGIPIKRFPAPWCLMGKGAGGARNEAMARYADALVALWDGKSPGTRDMIRRAEAHGLKAHVVRVL